MLAEPFALRPLGIEPVEHMLQVGLRNAGALVLDRQFHLPVRLARAQPDAAARRAERLRVADQVAQHLHQPVLHRPGHHGAPAAPPPAAADRCRCRASPRPVRASARRIGTTSTRSAAMRDSSASSREASLTSLISRSSRVTSCAMIVSSWRCRTGSSMRRSVSMALRIEDSGFLISCATSAAKRSIASMRAHSACGRIRQRGRPARRPRRAAPAALCGTLPARPLPFAHVPRRAGQPQDRPRDGQRQVPRQQHRQRQRQAEQPQDRDAHGEQAGIDLARLARQQHDADGVPVMLHRLGHRHQQLAVLGAPDIRRHFRALAGAVQPQFLLHVGLPVQARRRGVVSIQRHRLVVRQQRQHLVVQPADDAERPDRDRPAAAAARY